MVQIPMVQMFTYCVFLRLFSCVGDSLLYSECNIAVFLFFLASLKHANVTFVLKLTISYFTDNIHKPNVNKN